MHPPPLLIKFPVTIHMDRIVVITQILMRLKEIRQVIFRPDIKVIVIEEGLTTKNLGICLSQDYRVHWVKYTSNNEKLV